MQSPEKEAARVVLPPVLEDRLDYLEQQVRVHVAVNRLVEGATAGETTPICTARKQNTHSMYQICMYVLNQKQTF